MRYCLFYIFAIFSIGRGSHFGWSICVKKSDINLKQLHLQIILIEPLATDHILMQPQALFKTMVTKAINTLSNIFRLKVDKSNTFQFHILPLYDEYIYIQNHKVLKR